MGSTKHCDGAQSERSTACSRLSLPRQVEVGAQFVAVNSFAEYETILTGANAQHCNGCAAAESEEAKGPQPVVALTAALPASVGGRERCGALKSCL